MRINHRDTETQRHREDKEAFLKAKTGAVFCLEVCLYCLLCGSVPLWLIAFHPFAFPAAAGSVMILPLPSPADA
jgi:hypothetical protein